MVKNDIRKIWPVAAIMALFAPLLVYRPGHPGLLLQTLFEWSHVPVFGLISLCLLALMPKSLPVGYRFALAFLVSLILAALSEAAQIPTSRDASWEDLLSDAVGAASFLMAAFAIGKRPLTAVLWAVPAGVILVWSAMQLITVSHAITKRNFEFPVIFDGDIDTNSTLVRLQNVETETQLSNAHAQKYTRVELSGAFWSLLEFHDVYPNWNEYTNLLLDLEIEGDTAMDINIRIHDRTHRSGDQDQSDRFDRKFTLLPGRNKVHIRIRDIANAPHHRRMDMTEVDALVVYSAFRNAFRVLRVYEIRLD